MPVSSSTPTPNVFTTLDTNVIAQLGTQVPWSIITAPIKGTVVPFRDRVSARRIINNDKAATFSRINSLTLGSGVTGFGFFSEGGTPNQMTYSEEQISFVKKSYGASLGASNSSILASQTPYSSQRLDGVATPSLEEKIARLLHIQYVEMEEWGIIRGNKTSSSLGFAAAGSDLQFNGLESQLVTAYNAGQTQIIKDFEHTSMTQALLVQLISELMQEGITPTSILTSPQASYAIKVAFAQYQTQGLPYDPVRNTVIPSPAGDLPVLTSKFIPTTTGSGSNKATAPIYILTEELYGQPLIYLEDQIPETMLTPEQMRQAGFATSQNFGVYAHSVLVVAAPSFQRKLTNIDFDLQGTIPTMPSFVYS